MSEVKQGSGTPTGNSRSFFKAVVVEVLYDHSLFSDDNLQAMIKAWKITNSKILFDAPLNSCIVKFFGGGTTSADESHVVFPFFPPHLAMPVKPGECVWIMSPSVEKPDPESSYWLCRIPGSHPSDDVNFTHWPRGFISGSNTSLQTLRTVDKAKSLKDNPPTPENPQGFTPIIPSFIPTIDGNDVVPKMEGLDKMNPFDVIQTTSKSARNFFTEPVPPYNKRIGDLVLQGSNNSLICLGTDRGWGYDDTESLLQSATGSNAQFASGSGSAGAIDIVVGRSRYFPTVGMSADSPGDNPERTAQRKTINTRNGVESLKDPKSQGLKANIVAGDPDFAADSSRLYVSMKSSGDKKLGLSLEKEKMPTPFESDIKSIEDSAYIIAKSDEIRIVARRQDAGEWYSNSEDINGSIRIVKEGKKGEDLAAVCLLPDGTIQVSGTKIFLGRTKDDGGSGGGPGPGESQPYVKYQDLEDLWNKTMEALDAFCQTLSTHTTPGYGAPSPQIIEAAATLKAEIASALKPEITNVKSERIFGE